MSAYYNEFDPFAAQWLRNLIAAGHIADGEVDDRSIVDVLPSDLEGFTQCHFFAGIGIWSHALRSAGWSDDRPVWTGSCPCQGHSSAAAGKHKERNWWPEWERLIVSNRPRVIFGEQVAHQQQWISSVGDALEGMGYSFGAAVIPACSVGKDHIRNRFYFVGYSDSYGEPISTINAKTQRMQRNKNHPGNLVRPHGNPPRMAVLRSIGNSIVAPQAAAFIGAVMDVMP